MVLPLFLLTSHPQSDWLISPVPPLHGQHLSHSHFARLSALFQNDSSLNNALLRFCQFWTPGCILTCVCLNPFTWIVSKIPLPVLHTGLSIVVPLHQLTSSELIHVHSCLSTSPPAKRNYDIAIGGEAGPGAMVALARVSRAAKAPKLPPGPVDPLFLPGSTSCCPTAWLQEQLGRRSVQAV